jgi:nitrogenase molybdenum-iron protein alpha chain
VSQSAGHHIANNNLFKFVVGTDDTPFENKYTINMLGEYNIGGDSWEIHRLLNKCGIDINATFSGDVTYGEIARSHMVNLNLVQCHRSINYVAEMMEKKYGIPWLKVNFIGADSAAKSMRKIARYFEDQELINKVEKVIEEEMAEVTPVLDEIKPRTQGKKAILVVGGSRAHHYQALFKEMGMEVIAGGYEFAHRDDYEGREVLPTVKIDADSRNIEELEVEQDPGRYNPRKSKEELEALCAEGVCNADYDGMMPDMKAGSLVIDDMSHYEMEKMIEYYEPAIFCSGIKDKYVIEKMGVPCKQLHNYDYSGPFAGFKGAINFYKDIDRMVNSQVWQFVKAPWEKSPEIRGKVVNE